MARRRVALAVLAALLASWALVNGAPVSADIGIASGFSLPTGDTTPGLGSGGSSGGSITLTNAPGSLPTNDTMIGAAGGGSVSGAATTINPAETNLSAVN